MQNTCRGIVLAVSMHRYKCIILNSVNLHPSYRLEYYFENLLMVCLFTMIFYGPKHKLTVMSNSCHQIHFYVNYHIQKSVRVVNEPC